MMSGFVDDFGIDIRNVAKCAELSKVRYNRSVFALGVPPIMVSFLLLMRRNSNLQQRLNHDY